MVESSQKKWKPRWEKEKLLVTSNFSILCGVFKRLVLYRNIKQGLVWERVTRVQLISYDVILLLYLEHIIT